VYQTAIYPGTFDPITNGHLDLVLRACRLFQRVIVAVGNNSAKKTLLNHQDRIQLTESVLKEHQQVTVLGFEGLLVEFANQHNVNLIIRGFRTFSDFDYEMQAVNMNRSMMPELETIFFTPSERYSWISAQLVREIVQLGGDVSNFVPKAALIALQKYFKRSS
jgi:pantetheine-phosphate adenylyltransferase